MLNCIAMFPAINPARGFLFSRSATVQAGRMKALPSLRASSTALPLAGGPQPFTAGKNRLGRSDPKPVCLGGLALCSVTTRPWSVPPQAGQGISFSRHTVGDDNA